MKAILFGLAVVSFAPGAPATTIYSSRAAWEAAVPGFVTDDFESYPVQRISSGSIVYNDFDFVVPFNHQNVGNCWTDPSSEGSCFTLNPPAAANMILAGDVHEDEDGSYNELVFHAPIYAFGVDVVWTEDAQDGVPIVFALPGMPEEVSGPHFIGVVSDVRFTSIRISGETVAYQVDNVSYAFVPEPASGLLLAAGLLAFAVSRSSIASAR